jgi:hypothetical protein
MSVDFNSYNKNIHEDEDTSSMEIGQQEDTNTGKRARPTSDKERARRHFRPSLQVKPSVGEEFNPWNKFVGALVPNWLMERSSKDISPGAKLCYARLVQHGGRNARAFPSAGTLARELGASESNVRKYLDELRTKKLITSRQRGLGKSNTYQFLWHEWMDEAAATPEQSDALAERALSATDTGTGETVECEPVITMNRRGKLSGHLDHLDDCVVAFIESEYGKEYFQTSVTPARRGAS